jgi:hypothetical protein
MEYIPEESWAQATGIGKSGRAFVHRWLELFHRLSLDLYRVRHLNVRLAFEELRAAISDHKDFQTDYVNVKDLAAETLHLLKQDIVVTKVFPQSQLYHGVLAHANSDKSLPAGLSVLIEQACETFKRDYRKVIIQELRSAITADDVDRTIHLTSLLASDLIGDGYDHRHLYWRGEYFTKPPQRSFSDKLNDLLNDIEDVVQRNHTIATRLTFTRADLAAECPSEIGDVKIQAQLAAASGHQTSAYNKIDPVFRYATCQTNAPDPFAACRRGMPVLSRALDLLKFTRPMLRVEPNRACLGVSESGQEVITPINLELLGPIRLLKEEIETRLTQISAIHRDDGIDIQTKNRLSLGLQNLRLGLEGVNPQQQFLSLWIGLEAIAGGKHRTEMTTLRRWVPPTVTLSYPRSIIVDLRENFLRLHIDLRALLNPQARTSQRQAVSLEDLWRAICAQHKREQLITAASTFPLLQSRIVAIGKLLDTSQATRQTIERYRQDVEWHIQRMYRIRNAIVHGGYIPEDLTHLGSHLATYLWTVLRALTDELTKPTGLRDISKFFDKMMMLYGLECEQLEQGGSTEPNLPFLLHPEIMWP